MAPGSRTEKGLNISWLVPSTSFVLQEYLSWILQHFPQAPLHRNLRLLFLLYWDETVYLAWLWLARVGVESRINKTNTNNQVRVTWEKKEKQL